MRGRTLLNDSLKDSENFPHEPEWYLCGGLRIHDGYVCVRPGKSGERREPVVIPSDRWPTEIRGLEVFHYGNTHWLNAVDYPSVVSAVDAVTYRIGFCYTNTEAVCKELSARGMKATPYVGWAFTSQDTYPFHHCWCVIETEHGKSVIDLSDDYAVMRAYEPEKWVSATLPEARQLMVGFTEYIKKNNIPNSERCFPLGQVNPIFLLIGSPCDPQRGRMAYNRLMAKYKGHPAGRLGNADHRSQTQQMLYDAGLV